MKTALRAALLVVSVAAIAAAGTASVRAADPTLGVSTESHVYLDENSELTLWNRSTVPAAYTITAHDGWLLEPATFVLQPDETVNLPVTGDGPDGSEVDILVESTETPAPGAQANRLAITSMLYLTRPFDPTGLIPPVLGGIVALAAILLLGRRLIRFVRSFEISRKEA